MLDILQHVDPRMINTELACIVGLNEAIVLQQLHYWIERNKANGVNYHDNRYWTFGTVQEYRDRDFPFWSYETVKRTFGKLISQGFVITGNYNKMKMDMTKWYTIDYAAVDEYIAKTQANPEISH